ncbi:MAG: hypothetical protein HYU39_08885 [Thaumarchaeota archaeon]|nr:hypothetical protein [Nitrososphaerota archaeon]
MTKYFHTNGLLIVRVAHLATAYFHQDTLGSTRLTTDGAKAIQLSSNGERFLGVVNAADIMK